MPSISPVAGMQFNPNCAKCVASCNKPKDRNLSCSNTCCNSTTCLGITRYPSSQIKGVYFPHRHKNIALSNYQKDKIKKTKVYKSYKLFKKYDEKLEYANKILNKIETRINLNISRDRDKFVEICKQIKSELNHKYTKDQFRRTPQRISDKQITLYEFCKTRYEKACEIKSEQLDAYIAHGAYSQDIIQDKQIDPSVKWEVLMQILDSGCHLNKPQLSNDATLLLNRIYGEAIGHRLKINFGAINQRL